MTSSENTPEAVTSKEHPPGFRPLNPALVTALVTFIAVSLISGGLTLYALFPLMRDGRPPFALFFDDNTDQWILVILACLLLLGWVVSGYAGRRRWLQVVASIGTFAAAIVISMLLAGSALVAGMAH